MLRDTSSIKKEATKVILSDHGMEIDLQEDTVTISRFSVFCKNLHNKNLITASKAVIFLH
jgi:hypothetical protein